MIVDRIIDPTSKLAAARALAPATASSSLGEELGLGEVDEDELYTALDWLLERQPAIETALAKRHLKNGTLVLYDVSSSYMEGRCCPLAQRGYSRDGTQGHVCRSSTACCAPPTAARSRSRCSRATPAIPKTLAAQVEKLKQRFDLDHVVLVGDRGMITQARITEDIDRPGSTGSPRCARRRSGTGRAAASATVAVRPARHGQHHLPRLSRRAADRLPQRRSRRRARPQARGPAGRHRARPRRIQAAVARKRDPLRGAAEIALAVGAVINKHKMRKHFDLDDHRCASSASPARPTQIAAEAAIDGIYVVRTSLPTEALDDADDRAQL